MEQPVPMAYLKSGLVLGDSKWKLKSIANEIEQQ